MSTRTPVFKGHPIAALVFICLSVFVISYTASMTWGNLDLESYRDAQVTAAKAPGPSKIGLTFQLRF